MSNELPPIPYNAVMRWFADQTGVEVGSPAWVAGGVHAASWWTGEHPAYAPRQVVAPHEIGAVLANAGHRPAFYMHAPKRQVSYEAAGRPVGWTPSDAFDMPDGTRLYLTSSGAGVVVNGIDIQHFHISRLAAVFDMPPVTLPGMPYHSRAIAGAMIRGLMDSLCGMVAQLSKDPKDWPGDRAAACIMKAVAQSWSRGLLSVENTEKVLPFYELMLKIWEGPPHKFPSKKYADSVNPPVVENPYHVLQVYNGMMWLIRALWMLRPLLPSTMWPRLDAVILNMARRIRDLHEMEGNAAAVAAVSFPNSMLDKPFASTSWKDCTIHYSDNATWWGIPSLSLAAHILGDAELESFAAKLAKLYATHGKDVNPGWLINWEGVPYDTGTMP